LFLPENALISSVKLIKYRLIGTDVTEDEYDRAVKGKKTFEELFLRRVMSASNLGNSWSIMILPFTDEEPSYRDKHNG
jgi:hypothetical protein